MRRRLIFCAAALLFRLVLGAGAETQAQGGPVDQGSGAPILVVASAANPFTRYYGEILRAEGLNAFDVADISSVTPTTLAAYDVVILGEMPLSTAQVTMFSNSVNAGGNLIAMRPDKQLAGLLKLTDTSTTLADAYLLVNTSSGPGVGIVNRTIQFHGAADRYVLNGATSIATLYSDAATPTPNPAVTLASVGTNGGQAAAFTYDLARSIVYMRQGNPAWSGQERDGFPPMRSNDLYFGAASFDPQRDWIDLSKVAIPQGDEQQRLLANLIAAMNLRKKPLPRFWYFPKGKKAVIVMTGDDHAFGGTAGRFDDYKVSSPPNCSVANWECIRSTSYIYVDTPLSNAQAAAYNADGFEIALHVLTNCADWTPAALESFYFSQLSQFQAKYTSLPAPSTNRTHCGAWSDYSTQAQTELNHGIRFDTNYYYWPGSWILDRPGMFTGSGIPMRFADANGNIIDIYQAPTQMTDESNQSYPFTVNTLLDNALGPAGYYGAFTVNAHTNYSYSEVSNSVVDAALARGVPIVSSRQMLTWLDGRNASSFGALGWDGQSLSFALAVSPGAEGLLQGMVPAAASGASLTTITLNGSPIGYTTQTIKGVRYAFFQANSGSYRATYVSDSVPPVISNVAVTGISTGGAAIAWSTDKESDSQVEYGLTTAYGSSTPLDSTLVNSHSMSLAGLLPNTLYHFRVRSRDAAGNLAVSGDFTFTTLVVRPCPCSIWNDAATPVNDTTPDANPIELGVKFRSDINGFITGLRFYKGSLNTGTHIANLWTSTGTVLATTTFNSETPSGWQQANFATPVAITMGTTYVASYHTDAGYYADDDGFFSPNGVDNSPLHALATGVDGPNGVYVYGPSGFPNQTYLNANYWVDLVFTYTASAIAITSPNSGGRVSGTVSVSATVAGPTGIAGVQFFLDGANLGPEISSPPYTTSWDTTRVGNGSHVLAAVASRVNGAQATSDPVSVIVSNDPNLPTVAITMPPSGATVSGTAAVSAMASDDVIRVQFLLDGANLGSEVTTAPYSLSWDTRTVADGSHNLSARARNAAGGQSTAAPVSVTVANGSGGGSGFSLRFHGNGVNDIDRVKILIHSAPPIPDPPANVGATDFTLEFWMKALAGENPAGAVSCGDRGNIDWIFGNILLDRDRFNQGRKFGISIAGGVLVFGVSGASTGTDDSTICGATNVLDNQWHHVAVERALDGRMRLFVDGVLDAQSDRGPTGDISYPSDGVPGNFCGPNGLGLGSLPCTNDVFLVIGAEKHDAGPRYPSFSGWITEVRLSSILRYRDAGFARPTQRFAPDANTVALYHFGEGAGNIVNDASNAPGGPSIGVRNFGGLPAGPEWTTDTPFN